MEFGSLADWPRGLSPDFQLRFPGLSEARRRSLILSLEKGKKTMNTLAKWNPLQELDEFSNRLSSLVGRPTKQKRDEDNWFTQAQWSPLVDISEDDQEYLIKAELPGIEKDQVKVTMENGLLLITGERTSENEEKNKKYHRVERSYGSFLRTFGLPDDADGTKIKAEFKNGVLKVHVPKSENAKPKSIEIKVS
jgi:HSP20 family protein